MQQKFNKNILVSLITLILIGALLLFGYVRENNSTIDNSFYDVLLESNFIEKGEIEKNYLIIYTKDKTYKIPKDSIDLKELSKKVVVTVNEDVNILSASTDIVVITLFLIFIFLLIKNSKKEKEIFQKESIQKKEEPKPAVNTLQNEEFGARILPMISNVKFTDVAGIKEVKEELEEIIDFLKNEKKYRDFGISLPKGVLLIGPPGVGKTLIAKAVAGEAGVPFFYQSGSSFVQMYVGIGAKRVRDLFLRAKTMSPSIIFIDEIDAVGKARGGFRNDEREATLNQLLTEMDGFEERSGVIVIGATNRLEMLDEALLRSGRFDRRVFVGLPNLNDRAEIFKVYLKDKPSFVDIDTLSKITVGFSGASIASFVNEASINAVKRNSTKLELLDFLQVKDKVLLGKKKKLSFSEQEKKILATYQAAKAISAYWYSLDFDKLSLISDGFKEIDKEIISKTEMLSKIKVYLSGSAALELIYNESYSNNQEDLLKAKIIANEMVDKFGMGDRLIGDIGDTLSILQISYNDIKTFINGVIPILQKIETKLLENEFVTREELKICIDEAY